MRAACMQVFNERQHARRVPRDAGLQRMALLLDAVAADQSLGLACFRLFGTPYLILKVEVINLTTTNNIYERGLAFGCCADHAIMKKILLDIFGELLSHARMYVNNTPIHACLYVPSWLGLLTCMHCTVSTPEIV